MPRQRHEETSMETLLARTSSASYSVTKRRNSSVPAFTNRRVGCSEPDHDLVICQG